MSDPGGYAGVGSRVGARYLLEEMIGGGAMGTVWRATDELLNREVAIKEILWSPGATEEHIAAQRERALREGRLAARVTNVHAIAMYDVAMEAGEPWLVMEYLPSSNLGTLIASELVLPVTQVAQIGAQVADAMVDVHAAGILHRDIKPANVLVGEGGDSDGVVKITDFGISHLDGDASLSEAGTLTGTPAYFAPEVARGAPSTAASDVFSLGATLFACLEGVPPFGRDDDQYLMLRRVAGGVTDPLTRAGAAEAVISRMLAPDPAARPTMSEVRDELAEVAAGRPAALPEVLAARTRLNPVTRVAAGLGALAAIGGALGAASTMVTGGSTGASAGAASAAGAAGGAAGAGTAAAAAGSAVTAGGAAAAPGVGAAAEAGPVGAGAAGVAPSGAATGALTTSTVAKAGGFGALLTKPVLIAASVGAVVLAGGGAAVVLRGSSTTAPVAAAPTSSSQLAPTTSANVTAADAEQAVRALLTRLSTDPTGALATAGPSLQGLRPATVMAYFDKVTSLQVGAITAQDGGAVTAELLVTLDTGSTTSQQLTFTVTVPATPPTGPSSAAPSTAATPPSATAGTTPVPTSTSAPPPTASTTGPLVVDSPQLAALLVAGPPKTSPPTLTKTAPPSPSSPRPSAGTTVTATSSPSTSPGPTPTTIPSSTPTPPVPPTTTTP